MKAVAAPVKRVTAGSLAASYTSPTINALQDDVVGIQLNYTGSPVGTLALQGSLDQVNWTNLPVSVDGSPAALTLAIPASTSPILIDMISGSIPFVRVLYTRASGTGAVDVWTTQKRIGD